MVKNGRTVQYIVAFSVSLAAMTSSVAFNWTAPITTKFHNKEINLNVTDSEISWMLAMTSPGVVTGCLVARFSSDMYGRRATLLASAFPFIVGTIFVVNASSAWMLYITRYVWGVASGMISTVSTIYLAEISDKDIRGKLSVANRFMFNFGTVLVLVIGAFVSYEALSYMLAGLSLCYFVACWWIPETPYYLLKEKMVDKARKELLKLSTNKDPKEIEERLTLMNSDVKIEMSRSGSLKELLIGKQYRRALIISIGLRITKMLSGSITIVQYLGTIIQESNFGMSGSTALIIFGVLRFVAGIMASMAVDNLGRRPLLIYSFFVSTICLAVVGGCFFVQEVVGIRIEPTSTLSYLIFIGINLFGVISTFGVDTLIFVIPAEIFPLNVKSVAMTFLNILGGFLSFVAFIGYQIVKDLTGLYGVFWTFALIAFTGFVFSYTTITETKGKSLREIQIELHGNIYEGNEDKLDVNDVKNTEDVEANAVELKPLEKVNRQTKMDSTLIIK